MGKRNKLKRFEDLKNFDFVFDADFGVPENWQKKLIRDSDRLVLEVGCGKGAYTVGLAEREGNKNCVGIDVKGERIWVGAKTAREKNLQNVFFVRGKVNDIETFFKPKSVGEIWITFPDPFPRGKQAKHRLTSPFFLEKYKKLLASGGVVHLKTDDESLFEYTIEIVQQNGGTVLQAMANIYQDESLDEILKIQTDFEKKHLARGKKIFYVCFRLD